MNKVQKQAICDALNKLFWKIPPVCKGKSNEDNADWLIAELRDADIRGIRWNNVEQIFVVGKSDLMSKYLARQKSPNSLTGTAPSKEP